VKVLVLAGSGEARVLVTKLAQDPRHRVTASLAGATREPVALPVATRRGGFGSAQGFADYLRAQDIDAVIDATHPFAHRMTVRSFQVAAQSGVPYLLLLRPAWTPQAGDHWRLVDTEADVAALVPDGSTVFLATGRQTLQEFSNLSGCQVICRQIDAAEAPFPFSGGRFLIGRPPFSMQDEQDLFKRLGVDWLVVKNAGGAASRTKLEAARALGLCVAMIRRPDYSGIPQVPDVDGAVAWLEGLA
jgi:precorrin-6A/cobalt-precorrin-6A reductase